MSFAEFSRRVVIVPELARMRGQLRADQLPDEASRVGHEHDAAYSAVDHEHDPDHEPFELLSYNNALSGGSPALDGSVTFYLQCGSNVIAASGDLISFGTPFPGGLISVTACFGDSPGASSFYISNASASGFRFYSGAGVGHRVNWIAIGY